MTEKSRRQKILEALTDLLENVTEANGYDHNLTVRRGQLILDDNDLKNNLPLLTILESPKTEAMESPQHGATRKSDWELFLSGWVPWKSTHPTDNAHDLLRDVKRCLGQTRKEDSIHYLLGGSLGINTITVGGGICRPKDDNHQTTFFVLPLTITFVENLEAP